MGDSWYCLIFGEELGPMSWDDLVGMASRGTLSRNQKVKRGSDGDWVEAQAIDGLFVSLPQQAAVADNLDRAADLHRGTAWLCQVLGEELGPFTWAELSEMAHRGRLTRTQSVRQVGEAIWCKAEQVEGLFVGPAKNDETDFEVLSSSPAQPRRSQLPPDDADFDVAAPLARSTAEATEFDVAQPTGIPEETAASSSEDAGFELAAPTSVPPADDRSFDVTATERSAQHEAEATDPEPGAVPASRRGLEASAASESTNTDTSSVASTSAKKDVAEALLWALAKGPPATPAPPDAKPTKAKKKKEKPKKQPRAKSASAGLSGESKRAIMGTIGVASLAGLAYVAYLGIVALASMRSVNYDEVMAGYDQLYQQAKQAQSDTSLSSDPKVAAQFLARINELRGPMQDAQPGSPDAELYEAGAMLVELYAAAAAPPRSEVAHDREETDKKYLSKIAAVRTELGRSQ